jgi:SAM-dependent methyltransferase
MEHLRRIREYELELVLPLLPRGAKILEVGAGAGWQARALAERGYAVEAVDTEGGGYEQERIWPVAMYDGHVLPFADETFDVVFSSNVLEHIPHVEQFQRELQRVLKDGGAAVHLLPSASWRFWTSVTHYAHLSREFWNSRATLRARLYHFRTNLRPPRHGERGSALTEIYDFSRRAWVRLFEKTGWTVERTGVNRLFYTGYDTFHSTLPLRTRRWMSYALGSSCNLICLRKPAARPPAARWQRPGQTHE